MSLSPLRADGRAALHEYLKALQADMKEANADGVTIAIHPFIVAAPVVFKVVLASAFLHCMPQRRVTGHTLLISLC